MIESRCGILCSRCTHKLPRQCPGCLAMTKPFWGERCPVKSCCEEKGHEHCGECAGFPCELLKGFAYDPQDGDGGRRICQCKAWACKVQKAC